MHLKKLPNSKLERRITLTLLCFAGAVALIVQVAGHIINEKVEHGTWRAALNATSAGLALSQNSAANMSFESKGVHVWSSASVSNPLPAELQKLSPGFHEEINVGNTPFNVLVEDFPEQRRIIGFDISDVEKKELRLFIGTLIGLAIFLIFLAKSCAAISRWVLAPVHDLAKEVRVLQPGSGAQTLADRFSGSELAVIAEAVDRFIERINSFVQREKEFSLTASHELRTPIAVIAGALDVLDTLPALPEKSQKPLERIRKSTTAMSQLSSALLYISREERDSQHEQLSCALDKLLPEIIDSHHHLLDGKDVSVRLLRHDPCTIEAASPAIFMAIGNLIRNAIEHTPRGAVEISLLEGTLEIRDRGEGLTEEQMKKFNAEEVRPLALAAHESGIGLYIVRKLCARYGWKLTFAAHSEGGTSAALRFHDGSTQLEREHLQRSRLKVATQA